MRAMPGLIMIRPCDANEVREAWKVILAIAPRAGRPGADAPSGSHDRPLPIRRRVWVGARRLHPGGRSQRRPRRDSHRNRQRSLALSRCSRTIGQSGCARACGQHAVMGTVRGSGSRLPGHCSAAACESASFRGGSFGLRLDQIHRNRGREHRHRNIRGLGTHQTTVEEIRIYRGSHRGRGKDQILHHNARN